MATVGANVFQFAQPSDFDSIEEYTRHELERALDYIQARQQSSNTQLDSSINEIKELRDEVETLRGADPVGATITLEQVRALVATAIGQIKSPVGSTHPEWDEIRNKPYILTYDQILKLNDIQANSDVTGERNVRRALTNLKRDITLNGRKIRFVGTPQNSDDVANKRYVDELSGQPTEHGVRIAADKLSSELRVNRQRITDLATPKNNNDAATKKYVDDQVIANPIIPVPVITDQTISLKIPSGTFGTLNITATGIGLSYQWYTGASGNTTSSIAGAVSDQYATPTLTANTNYWCRVTNVTGSVDSVTITITVTIAVPVITAQSDNSSVTTGDNITLSVTVTGTGLSYQWYKGVSGSTASLISGATARSYTTDALTIGLSRFWCRVTNAGGTADSTTITITASIAAPIITTQPSGGTITTGQTLDLTVVASGTGLSYQWYTGNSGSLTSPIAGATNSSYNTGILSGGSHKFWVRVTNSSATADSNTATVAVDLILPVIRTQPVGGTFQISQSSAIRISVSVIGSGLSYQWYFGNSGATTSPIAGATSSSYGTGTLSDGSYSYWVRITNSDGSIDSNQADILVTFNLPVITTQPVGGNFQTNDSISLDVTATGNGLSYQWYTGVSGVTTSPILGATLAAYSFGTLSAGSYNYWVRVSNTGGSVDSDTASFSVGVVAPVISRQSSNFSIEEGNSSVISVTASGASLTYQWYTGLSSVATSPISGAISSSYSTGSLTHGTKNYWVRVTNPGGFEDSTTITITVTYRIPVISSQPPDKTIPAGQAVSVAVVAVGKNLSYQWYLGVSGDATIITIIPGATSSDYTISALSTGTYYFWVRISNDRGSVDSDTSTITITLPLPVITSQPASPNTNVGRSLDLSVTATGTGLTYQWYHDNSGRTANPIRGETSDSYTTVVFFSAGTRRFWVRVTGPSGHVDSNTAVVRIIAATSAIVITSHPSSASINTGVRRTLTVVATGSSLRYQWYTGNSGSTGSPISGATGRTYRTPSYSTTGTRRFWVRVRNSSGSTDSNTATISVTTATTITPPPVITPPVITNRLRITSQPSGATIFVGSSATLRVTASGRGLTYQWYIGSSPSTLFLQTGKTSRTYTSRTFTSTGNFSRWVRVTDSAGRLVNSVTAVIRVVARVAGAPVITSQPSGGTIDEGESFTMSVTASGSGKTYRWYEGTSGSTSNRISSASSSSYTKTFSDSGTYKYWVRVNNSSGSVDSNTVTVTVEEETTSTPVTSTNTQSFSSSGTWSRPTGFVSGTAYMWGGGGGGNGGNSGRSGGSGGGYSSTSVSSSVASSVSVSVGAGGSGGSSFGGRGGSTSFGSSSAGGSGGGTGGSGERNGHDGNPGHSTSSADGGDGGEAPGGSGSRGQSGSGSSGSGASGAGGGGGASGRTSSGTGSVRGGNGGSGGSRGGGGGGGGSSPTSPGIAFGRGGSGGRGYVRVVSTVRK